MSVWALWETPPSAKSYRIHIVSSDAFSRRSSITYGRCLAAIQVGQRLGSEATIVTLMADSGLKYLSTDVYKGRRLQTV